MCTCQHSESARQPERDPGKTGEPTTRRRRRRRVTVHVHTPESPAERIGVPWLGQCLSCRRYEQRALLTASVSHASGAPGNAHLASATRTFPALAVATR